MSEQQCTADVLMIRPANFSANAETAASNRFQGKSGAIRDPQTEAVQEFDALVSALNRSGVRTHVFDDTPSPVTPDALFPNNWLSLHGDGSAVFYPMLAPNRRLERRSEILESLSKQHGFQVRRLVDFSHRENQGRYLEGTGSLVLDRVHRIAYAALSPRTDLAVLGEFAQQLDYELVAFDTRDANGYPIYHTNVLMSVGRKWAVLCSAAIEGGQRAPVQDSLLTTGHTIVEISSEQMSCFAGNILELATVHGGSVIALSKRAEDCLEIEQRKRLESLGGPLVSASIPTIETLGGGSVRCMLAEIHLPHAERT